MVRTSAILRPFHMRGLQRLGDIYAPGTETLPSFSAVGCAEQIDRLLAYTSDEDVRTLKRLFTIVSLLPSSFAAVLIHAVDRWNDFPGFVGAALRRIRINLRSLIYSLYYSDATGFAYLGATVHQTIGYDVSVAPDEDYLALFPVASSAADESRAVVASFCEAASPPRRKKREASQSKCVA